MVRKAADRYRVGALVLTVGLAVAAVNVASAAEIRIGGFDAETQYTGAGTTSGSAGVLTFYDVVNGYNDAEFGEVDSVDPSGSPLDALLTGKIWFEAMLDTNGFDPATDNIRLAQFIGTGTNPELFILDPADNVSVLLSFDLNFIKVTQAFKKGIVGGPTGKILLGNPQAEQWGITSALSVAGGSLANLVGGVGTRATLEVMMADLAPPIATEAALIGYFNDNFTNGINPPPSPATTWNLTIVPEPSTAVLLGFALLGIVAAARRGVRR